MGEEKAVKPKQTGIALETDVIKKIAHQLERLPPGAGGSVIEFMARWSARQPITDVPLAPNGQLPLAAKEDGFPE